MSSGIHVDSAEKREELPEYDTTIKCKEHPNADVEDGYGMASGGLGVYNYCGKCGKVLSKSLMEE